MDSLFTEVSDLEAQLIDLLASIEDEDAVNWELITQFIPTEPMQDAITYREASIPEYSSILDLASSITNETAKDIAYYLTYDAPQSSLDTLVYWLDFYDKDRT